MLLLWCDVFFSRYVLAWHGGEECVVFPRVVSVKYSALDFVIYMIVCAMPFSWTGWLAISPASKRVVFRPFARNDE